MSNRDSLGFGELIPHDVVEIFAQEKHHKKGRKKRSHSLGRALGWLKGKKRKNLDAHAQNPGLGPALDLALDGHVAAHLGGNKGGHKSGRQTQGNSHGKNPSHPLSFAFCEEVLASILCIFIFILKLEVKAQPPEQNPIGSST